MQYSQEQIRQIQAQEAKRKAEEFLKNARINHQKRLEQEQIRLQNERKMQMKKVQKTKHRLNWGQKVW